MPASPAASQKPRFQPQGANATAALMRLSMVGLYCYLAARGIRRAEGQSRLEHLRAAEPHVHPLTYRWWLEATECYGACRFGGRPATRDAAKVIGDGVNAGRRYAAENRRSASRRAL